MREARIRGGVAQLGEHLPCKQGVKSSNLSISTREAAKRTSGPTDSQSRRSTPMQPNKKTLREASFPHVPLSACARFLRHRACTLKTAY